MEEAIENYVLAWNTGDGVSRKALLDKCFSVKGTYVDEHVPAPVHDLNGMLEVINTFRSRLPHKIVLKAAPQIHNHVFRLRWSLQIGDEKLSEGEFVGTVDENVKISSVIGFLDR